jgi:hypothetical protein
MPLIPACSSSNMAEAAAVFHFIRYILVVDLAYSVCVALTCGAVVYLSPINVSYQERDNIRAVI